MTREEITVKYSRAFAAWYCHFNPDYEAASHTIIADMYESWLAGHNSTER